MNLEIRLHANVSGMDLKPKPAKAGLCGSPPAACHNGSLARACLAPAFTHFQRSLKFAEPLRQGGVKLEARNAKRRRWEATAPEHTQRREKGRVPRHHSAQVFDHFQETKLLQRFYPTPADELTANAVTRIVAGLKNGHRYSALP
jgi:hypothetical protein